MKLKTLVLLFVICVSHFVHAHTLYTVTECQQYRDLMFTVATAKQRGLTFEETVERLNMILSDEPFIQDEDDLRMVGLSAKAVYNSPMGPNEIRDTTYRLCLKVMTKNGEAL